MAEDLVLETTDTSDIPTIVAKVRDGFRSHKTLELPYRIQQLKSLKRLLDENCDKIEAALYKDLRKGEFEAKAIEMSVVMGDIIRAIDNVAEWVVPQYQPRDLLNQFNTVYLMPEPYGTVLILGAWNFPVQLIFLPLIGAIAAGNCSIIKPSERSVASSNLIAELIPKYLDPECYAVITGAVDCSKAVLEERYDYIFYTGGTEVGKLVMKKAAENVTPVTLELGGKSPAFVAPDANVKVAAQRIMWGKCLNAGQLCIAPDYVLCTKGTKEKLIEACREAAKSYFGEDPQKSPDFGRIVNAEHFERLSGLIDGTMGKVVLGGERDASSRYISPTLVDDVTGDDRLMTEEIFGPILPFVTVGGVDDAIQFISAREKPLALYVFTESSSTFKKVNKFTSAGGVLRNDVLLQASVPHLNFGGVGYSGLGSYHGKRTFLTFSHMKPVLETATGMEILNQNLRCAPYTKTKLNRMKWVLTVRPKGRFPWKVFSVFLLVALVAVVIQMYGLPTWLCRMLHR